MPIDDVDFLKKRSETNHNIILIDSNMRDHATYPTPSMYTIELQEPFYNVVGIEVLDASIPRTMYVIDRHNDKLVFYIGVNCMEEEKDNYIRLNKTGDGVTKATIFLDHMDCTMQELIDELNNKLGPYGIEVNAESPERLIKKSSLVFLSNKTPFVFDMWESTCNELLGINVPSTAVQGNMTSNNRYIPVHDPILKTVTRTEYKFITDHSANKVAVTNQHWLNNLWLYGSLTDENPSQENTSLSRYDLSVASGSEFYPSKFGNNQFAVRFNLRKPNDNDYYQLERFVIPMVLEGEVIPATLSMTFHIIKAGSSPSKFSDSILNTANTFDLTGRISLYTYEELIDLGYPAISYTNLGNSLIFGVLEPPTTYYIEGSSDYWLILKDTNPGQSVLNILLTQNVEYNIETLTKVNYFVLHKPSLSQESWQVYYYNQNQLGLLNISLDGTQLIAGDGSVAVPNLTLAMTIQTTKNVFRMYSPGVVSIIGPRYALLRCPEIEEHTQNTYAYTQNTQGMALFKLGVYGYITERYDFSTIKYKDFHPIARLFRITLKFTLPNGELYDFKGIDHHLLLSIKTLVPTQKEFDVNSTLNPNYNPDIIQYLTRKRLDDLKPLNYVSSEEDDDNSDDYDDDDDNK